MSVNKRVKEYLEDQGIEYRVLEHAPAYTAQQVAAVSHISGHEFAKVVMVKIGDEFVMTVLPASKRLSLDALQSVIGTAQYSRLAEEEEFADLFPDCELGAEPPFGNLYNLPVVVDQSLTNDLQIAFNAGTHRELIQIAYADYDSLVQPQSGEIVYDS